MATGGRVTGEDKGKVVEEIVEVVVEVEVEGGERKTRKEEVWSE